MVFLPGMVALTGQASGRDPQTTEQGVRYAHQPARRSQVLGLDTHALLLLPLSETLGARLPARLQVFVRQPLLSPVWRGAPIMEAWHRGLRGHSCFEVAWVPACVPEARLRHDAGMTLEARTAFQHQRHPRLVCDTSGTAKKGSPRRGRTGAISWAKSRRQDQEARETGARAHS